MIYTNNRKYQGLNLEKYVQSQYKVIEHWNFKDLNKYVENNALL